MSKTGRNDPCPCGSGKKYKRCCGRDHVAAPAGDADVHGQQLAGSVDLESALKERDELEEASSGVGDPSVGDIFQTRSQLAEAESSLLVHLELYQWLGSEEGMAAAYFNLGTAYQELGDLEAAEAMYTESLKIDAQLGRSDRIAAASGSLGRIHHARGDLAQAAMMHRKALEIHEAVGRKVGMATAYANLGLVHQMRGEIAQAAAMYAKSIALFRKARAIPQVRHLQRLLDSLTVA